MAIGLGSIAFGAQAFVVDFETIPELSVGPALFEDAGPVQEISVGDVIFDGGVVLGLPTFFPASPFGTAPNVYGTANHPSGRAVGDPSLSPYLSIDIDPGASTTTVEGLLFNGMIRDADYRIEAFAGAAIVDVVTFSSLAPNTAGGFELFRLSSDSAPITSILFTPDLSDGEWDYVIDTIAFNESLAHMIPQPGVVALFSLVFLVFVARRQNAQPALS